MLQPLLLLAARLYVSLIFFRAGMLKLADWSSTLALFRDTYKVPVLPPELAAYVGTFGELVFPVLIVLGTGGAFRAAGLFVVNVMAVVSYLDLFGFECPAGINAHFYWGSSAGRAGGLRTGTLLDRRTRSASARFERQAGRLRPCTRSGAGQQ